MARCAARQSQLAADVGAALRERHRVAGARRLHRGGHAGRAAADHQHASRGALNRSRDVCLAAGARVDHAADRRALVVVADACLVAADAGDRLGSPAFHAELLATAVKQLHEPLRPVGLHFRRQSLIAADDAREIAAERVRREQSRGVHRRGLEEDRAHAAAGARLVVGDEIVHRQVVVHQRRLMRRRDHAVAQVHRPEPDRAEQLAAHRGIAFMMPEPICRGRARPGLAVSVLPRRGA